MRIYCCYFLVTICIFVLSFSVAIAKEPVPTQVVKATGVAPSSEPAARELALEAALRHAVEQAVGVYVAAETVVQDFMLLQDEVYLHADGFIQSYEILSEGERGGGREEDTYVVTVQAVVAERPLLERLKALGVLLKLRVLVAVVPAGEGASHVAQGVLTKIFAEAGYRVLDTDPFRKALTGWQQGSMTSIPGVDFLVLAEAISTPGGTTEVSGYGGIQSTFQSVQGVLSARVVRVETGSVVAAKVATHTQAALSLQTATEKALSQSAQQVGEELVAALAAAETALVKPIDLTVTGLSYPQTEDLLMALREAPFLQKAELVRYSDQQADFLAWFQGESAMLAERFSHFDRTALLLPVPTTISASRLVYEAN